MFAFERGSEELIKYLQKYDILNYYDKGLNNGDFLMIAIDNNYNNFPLIKFLVKEKTKIDKFFMESIADSSICEKISKLFIQKEIKSFNPHEKFKNKYSSKLGKYLKSIHYKNYVNQLN